ncbi:MULTISPECIES: phage virion morphogenesis protein [Pectobacterium]|uniref:phage virion morphogenesis protein n=1 Tax=Pectobacterium TaxID=122277 RepID=UPI0005037927|nr:phage virion morphogenesis protein [Pectobacterium carotovorum]KFW97870.1 tail protein [Pectobacterium carotovorum subsp. carotovorum]KML68121.1 tail protein [Pectobacterium carotovorum subsp. carotovorum ICMP 5702]SHH66042.1 phage virion morphogenesis (putative tail completion) protein [Pectobacterium carotovorum]
MNELKPFDDKLAALIANLSASGRRKLAGTVAKALRGSQQQHIKAQTAPDGTAYAPRKAQPIKGKKGRVKSQMFQKLRTAKYLKAKGTADAASLEFIGRVQRMARVHHYGLRDRPSRNSDDVQYEARPLLGFSDREIEKIENEIIKHIQNN